MPTARQNQVSLQDTPYYHCISRCVRRAFLCGIDKLTGNSYEHRRAWVEQKLLQLPNAFAISVCAYAVMSNHTHIVLYVDNEKVQHWSLNEIVTRWHQLFSGTSLSQKYLSGQSLFEAEHEKLKEQAETWRERLTSISWFMRCLNEHIARQANQEDNCTGRFWEGRFKSQALLDEASLAACLAYVDLNPVRANITETPETSEYTSIKRRVQCLLNNNPQTSQPNELSPFVGNLRKDMPQGLPFNLKDYVELVDWTGRAIKHGKKGFISNQQPPILQRLNISPEAWLELTHGIESHFSRSIGTEQSLNRLRHNHSCRWVSGMTSAKRLFNSA